MTGETITVLRHGSTTDRYENTVPDWTDPTRIPIKGCAVAPRSTSEDNAGRQAVIVGLIVYTPAGVDIRPTDRVEVRGVVHEVDGEIGDWRNPFTGTRAGLEVQLKRAAG